LGVTNRKFPLMDMHKSSQKYHRYYGKEKLIQAPYIMTKRKKTKREKEKEEAYLKWLEIGAILNPRGMTVVAEKMGFTLNKVQKFATEDNWIEKLSADNDMIVKEGGKLGLRKLLGKALVMIDEITTPRQAYDLAKVFEVMLGKTYIESIGEIMDMSQAYTPTSDTLDVLGKVKNSLVEKQQTLDNLIESTQTVIDVEPEESESESEHNDESE